jgi:ribosome-associated translation inhibitor RaiA
LEQAPEELGLVDRQSCPPSDTASLRPTKSPGPYYGLSPTTHCCRCRGRPYITCPNRCVSRSRFCVGVIKVARVKVGPTLQKAIKPVRRLQRISVSIEIVASKLIDNQNHNELRPCAIDPAAPKIEQSARKNTTKGQEQTFASYEGKRKVLRKDCKALSPREDAKMNGDD